MAFVPYSERNKKETTKPVATSPSTSKFVPYSERTGGVSAPQTKTPEPVTPRLSESDKLKQTHYEHYKPYASVTDYPELMTPEREAYDRRQKPVGDRILETLSRAGSTGSAPIQPEVAQAVQKQVIEPIKEETQRAREIKQLPIEEQYRSWGFDIPEGNIVDYDEQGVPLGESGKRLVYSDRGGPAAKVPRLGDPEYASYAQSINYYNAQRKPFLYGAFSGVVGGTEVLDKLATGETKWQKKTLGSTEQGRELLEIMQDATKPGEITQRPTTMGAGEMAGRTTRQFALYMSLGPVIEKAVHAVPAISTLLTSGSKVKQLTGTFITEMAKDLALSTPISIGEAKAQGLEREDFWKYVGTEFAIDAATNLVAYGLADKAKLTKEAVQESIQREATKLAKDPEFVKQVDEILKAQQKSDIIDEIVKTSPAGRANIMAMEKQISQAAEYFQTRSVLANMPEIKMKDIADMDLGPQYAPDTVESLLKPKDWDFSPELKAELMFGEQQKIVAKTKKFPGVKKIWNTVKTAFDPSHPVKVAGEKAHILAVNSSNAITQTRYMIEEELFGPDLGLRGKSLKSIVQDIPEGTSVYRGKEMSNQGAFMWYLYNSHNVDTSKVGRQILENLGSKDSAEIVRQMETANPWMKERAKEVYEYNKVLIEWATQSGKLSKKQADVFLKKYPHYVPAYRDINKWYDPTLKVRAERDPFKRLTGSKENLLDPWANMSKHTYDMIYAAKEQDWKVEFYKQVKANPEKFAGVVKIKGVKKAGEDVIDMVDDIMKSDTVVPEYNVRGNNVELDYNGDKISMTLYDKNLYDRWFGGTQYRPEGFEKGIQMVTRAFKRTTTQDNPMFGVKNIFYDTPVAYINSDINNPVTFAKNLVEAANEMVNNGPIYQMYLRSGVTGAVYSAKHEGAQEAAKFLRSTKGLGKAASQAEGILKVFTEASENINRFAEFRYSYLNDVDIDKAIYKASEVTVNFSKGNKLLRHLEVYSPYSKAALLSAERAIRQMVNKPAATTLKALLTATPAVAGYLIWRDNPNYVEDVPEYDKQSNFIIPNMFGKKDEEGNYEQFITVPMGRDWAQIAGNIALFAVRKLEGDPNANAEDLIKTIVNSIGPNNPLTSNIFTPSIEAILNKRFTGGTIVPQRLENLSPQYQYTEETSEIGKFFGQMGIPPMAVDYILDRYFGFASDIILPATTKGESIWESISKPFTVDTAFENQTLNNFYDEYNKLLTKKADAEFVNADNKEIWIADQKQSIIQKHTTKINQYYSILRHLEQPTLNENERADLGDKLLNAIEDSVETLEEGAIDKVTTETERDLKALMEIGLALSDGDELTKDKRDELKRALKQRINAEARIGLERARSIEDITMDEILGIISIEQGVSLEEAGNILEEIIGGSQ